MAFLDEITVLLFCQVKPGSERDFIKKAYEDPEPPDVYMCLGSPYDFIVRKKVRYLGELETTKLWTEDYVWKHVSYALFDYADVGAAGEFDVKGAKLGLLTVTLNKINYTQDVYNLFDHFEKFYESARGSKKLISKKYICSKTANEVLVTCSNDIIFLSDFISRNRTDFVERNGRRMPRVLEGSSFVGVKVDREFRIPRDAKITNKRVPVSIAIAVAPEYTFTFDKTALGKIIGKPIKDVFFVSGDFDIDVRLGRLSISEVFEVLNALRSTTRADAILATCTSLYYRPCPSPSGLTGVRPVFKTAKVESPANRIPANYETLGRKIQNSGFEPTRQVTNKPLKRIIDSMEEIVSHYNSLLANPTICETYVDLFPYVKAIAGKLVEDIEALRKSDYDTEILNTMVSLYDNFRDVYAYATHEREEDSYDFIMGPVPQNIFFDFGKTAVLQGLRQIPEELSTIFLEKDYTGLITAGRISEYTSSFFGVINIPWSALYNISPLHFLHEIGHEISRVYVTDKIGEKKAIEDTGDILENSRWPVFLKTDIFKLLWEILSDCFVYFILTGGRDKFDDADIWNYYLKKRWEYAYRIGVPKRDGGKLVLYDYNMKLLTIWSIRLLAVYHFICCGEKGLTIRESFDLMLETIKRYYEDRSKTPAQRFEKLNDEVFLLTLRLFKEPIIDETPFKYDPPTNKYYDVRKEVPAAVELLEGFIEGFIKSLVDSKYEPLDEKEARRLLSLISEGKIITHELDDLSRDGSCSPSTEALLLPIRAKDFDAHGKGDHKNRATLALVFSLWSRFLKYYFQKNFLADS